MKATIEVTVTHKYRVDVTCHAEAESFREQLHNQIANGGKPDDKIQGVDYMPVIRVESGIPFVDMNW